LLANKRYDVKDDGLLHTSFSDLRRCSTTHGALTVAKETVLGKRQWGGDDFGHLRHEMFEQESQVTGRTPACFKQIGYDTPAPMPELRLEMDLMPGVVLHSTIDNYAPELFAIIDYKTFTNKADLQKYNQPAKKAQLITYALQLTAQGHKVNKVIFLGEQWDKARENLLGYDSTVIPIGILEMVQQKEVLKQNAIRLLSAIEVLETEQKILANS